MYSLEKNIPEKAKSNNALEYFNSLDSRGKAKFLDYVVYLELEKNLSLPNAIQNAVMSFELKKPENSNNEKEISLLTLDSLTSRMQEIIDTEASLGNNVSYNEAFEMAKKGLGI